MSQDSPANTSVSTSSFHQHFCNALINYHKKTKNDLVAHPLTADLQNCKLPNDLLAVLDKKYNFQAYIQFQSTDKTSEQWLSATFTILTSFSAALGELDEGVGLVFSPANLIFAGVGVILIAAKDVGVDKDAIVHIFGHIEKNFKRLDIFIELPPTDAMKELIIRIMVEVLEILAVVTKEIKQQFAKNYLKKLTGRTDIEDTLEELDKLTHEGALMANAQVSKVVESVENNTDKVIMIDGGNKARGMMRKALQEWLSPPDPSINYNTARNIYHDGTARWFTRGETIERWKVSGSESLLWIHGKPGSGKSILSSAIIYEIKRVSNAKPSCVIYFFFDLKDRKKRHTRAFLSSLLIQLCDQSDSCFKALIGLYSTHGSGTRQPNVDALSRSLRNMLIFLRRVPIYLIVDALDETNTSKVLGGLPSRQRVLEVVEELVELRLSNLHLCVTSRPEADIRSVLEPLACFKVSIHAQSGQKEDIDNYLRSVVYSNKNIATGWSPEDKDLVFKTLSEMANGMFRWVVCQLEVLRGCGYAHQIREVLGKLPASLSERYQRVLKGINEGSREDVCRLLQCLVASIRPLRVEELVEVLAADIDGAGGIPKLKPDRPRVDLEEALAACSSFITIIDTGDAWVVEFSHFSVRQFLTSYGLCRSSRDVSRYHISLEPAHTTLAQACIGVLLRLDDHVSEDSTGKNFPLAQYAARHWVKHAQFKNVSSRVRKGMEELFDPDRPHFSAWLRLYDPDTPPDARSAFFQFADPSIHRSTQLYYAALCGFRDLTKHLIAKHSQYVNAIGGYYVTPLVAALAGNHFQVAQLLHELGADVDVRGGNGQTPLFSSSGTGCPKIVRWLLNHGADVSVQVALTSLTRTPLHAAVCGGYPQVARILLDHKADVKARDNNGWTPLHLASVFGRPALTELFLGHDVDVNARAKDRSTPLHFASCRGEFEVVRLLVEHDADVGARDDKGRTALQIAKEEGRLKIANFLLEHQQPLLLSFEELFFCM